VGLEQWAALLIDPEQSRQQFGPGRVPTASLPAAVISGGYRSPAVPASSNAPRSDPAIPSHQCRRRGSPPIRTASRQVLAPLPRSSIRANATRSSPVDISPAARHQAAAGGSTCRRAHPAPQYLRRGTLAKPTPSAPPSAPSAPVERKRDLPDRPCSQHARQQRQTAAWIASALLPGCN
jgi:hypothetical protein